MVRLGNIALGMLEDCRKVIIEGDMKIIPDVLQVEKTVNELTHAIIDQKTKGNCPHWLQEGMAQFLDGTDVRATDAWLRRHKEFEGLRA